MKNLHAVIMSAASFFAGYQVGSKRSSDLSSIKDSFLAMLKEQDLPLNESQWSRIKAIASDKSFYEMMARKDWDGNARTPAEHRFMEFVKIMSEAESGPDINIHAMWEVWAEFGDSPIDHMDRSLDELYTGPRMGFLKWLQDTHPSEQNKFLRGEKIKFSESREGYKESLATAFALPSHEHRFSYFRKEGFFGNK